MWHDVIRLGLVRIFYPCLMIFGTIGNILCLKILLRKRFRRQSTCQYLCILAVIDILFIYMRSTRYLYRYIYKFDLRNTSVWICRTFIFFSSALAHIASWILVIVSFDRYFIIKNLFPRRHVACRVLKSSCILIIVVCVTHLHYFYILGDYRNLLIPVQSSSNESSNESFIVTRRFVCMAHEPFKEFFRLFVPIFDLLFVAIIPFCLMIFTNIGIIRTTMRSNLCITSRKQQRNNRLTIMLLSVILAFMLLTCPSVIYICLNRLTTPTTVSDTKLAVLDLLESLWYTKHALNFILYTLSGQDFRREFIKMFSCFHRKINESSSNHSQDHHHHHHRRERSIHSALLSKRSTTTTTTTTTKNRSSEPKTTNHHDQQDPIPEHPIVILSNSFDDQEDETPVETNADRRYFVLSACSSVPTRTSISSEQRRSSSMMRTSLH